MSYNYGGLHGLRDDASHCAPGPAPWLGELVKCRLTHHADWNSCRAWLAYYHAGDASRGVDSVDDEVEVFIPEEAAVSRGSWPTVLRACTVCRTC
jgi:hypothetical protein